MSFWQLWIIFAPLVSGTMAAMTPEIWDELSHLREDRQKMLETGLQDKGAKACESQANKCSRCLHMECFHARFEDAAEKAKQEGDEGIGKYPAQRLMQGRSVSGGAEFQMMLAGEISEKIEAVLSFFHDLPVSCADEGAGEQAWVCTAIAGTETLQSDML